MRHTGNSTRNTGGALVVCATLLALLSMFWVRVMPVDAQTVQNPLPLELTQQGVTLRITKAGFFTSDEAFAGLNADSTFGNWTLGRRKSFVLRYDIQRATPLGGATGAAQAMPGATDGSAAFYQAQRARAGATVLSLYAPTGEPLQPIGGGSRAGGSQQLQWLAVDPHWDHVTAEVMALDPAAPLAASGQDEQTLTFAHLAFPADLDRSSTVQHTLTTRFGAEVSLDNITIHRQATLEGKPAYAVDLEVSWSRPDDVPDLNLVLDFDHIGEVGKPPLSIPNRWAELTHDGPSKFHLSGLPPHALKDLEIGIRVHETAPSQRQMQWCRRFRCELKLPPLTALTPAPTAEPQMLVAQSEGGATGLLEDLINAGETDRSHGLLWLRDQTPADGSMAPLQDGTTRRPGVTHEWQLKSLAVRDEAGHELHSWWTPRKLPGSTAEYEPMAWHVDGTPAASGELGYPLYLDWANKPFPARLNFQATVAPLWHQHSTVEFQDLLVPTFKEPRDPELAAPAHPEAGRTSMRLRRIMRISDPRQFYDLADWQRSELRLGGLALLFEVMPDATNSEVSIAAVGAEDAAGHALLDPAAVVVAKGNMLPHDARLPLAASTKQSQWWTVCLLPPPPPVNSFWVRLVADEYVVAGQPTTLVFKDVRNVLP